MNQLVLKIIRYQQEPKKNKCVRGNGDDITGFRARIELL